MRRPTLTIVLYLAIVFASGVLVGAYGYRFVIPVAAKAQRPSEEEWRRQYLKEMQTRLQLTPDQLKQLNGIMDETRTLFHDARQKHNQIMKHLRDEQTDKVRAMLTDAQKPEYEKLRAERDQRAKAAR